MHKSCIFEADKKELKIIGCKGIILNKYPLINKIQVFFLK